jgi:hypothetical protein
VTDDLEEYIRRMLDQAPPLTPAQTARLSALFDYEPCADSRPAEPR